MNDMHYFKSSTGLVYYFLCHKYDVDVDIFNENEIIYSYTLSYDMSFEEKEFEKEFKDYFKKFVKNIAFI